MVDVLSNEVDDGVYEMTVNMYDDNHRFDISIDGSTAYVDYQETLNYRGEIMVSEPHDDVWAELITSEEFMNSIPNGVENVRRA